MTLNRAQPAAPEQVTPASGKPHLRDCVWGGTYARADGAGTPLVLIHGVGLDHTMWDGMAGLMARHHRVIRYDLLGHGQSAKPPGERYLADFAIQLEHLLHNLGIERAHIAGFSLGALVASAFAARFPDKLDKLVLMNMVHERTPEQRSAIAKRMQQLAEHGSAATVDAAIERWFTPSYKDTNPDVMATVRQRLLSNDPGGYLSAYRIFANADDEASQNLSDIRTPTLALTAQDDIGSTPDMTHAIAAVLSEGHAKIVPNLRHGAPIEDPGAVAGPMLDFLCD